MDENRLVDIETKLAHQEHLLDELNQVVTDQQARMSRLEEYCRSLAARLQSYADSAGAAGSAGDERPPHY